MRVVDLKCTVCGKELKDYFCLTNPDCCSVKMETDWSAGVCPGLGTWNINFTYEGVNYRTEGEWNRHLDAIRKANPGKEVLVTENSKAISQGKSDEAKHRAWAAAKAAGFDSSDRKKIQDEKKILKNKGEKVSKIFKEST